MERIRWRKVRVGTEHERGDREHNAESVLLDGRADDFVIAVGIIIGGRVVGLAGERWPLVESRPLCPEWAVGVAEQERQVPPDRGPSFCYIQ